MILAIDPGVTTGIAFKLDGISKQTCTLTSPQEVWDMVKMYNWKHVVIERFAAQTISKYGLHTVEIIGGVKALCYASGMQLTVQTPYQRKPFIEKAKKLLRSQPHEDHEVDALAHLLAWEYNSATRTIPNKVAKHKRADTSHIR
jgi:hypothetical protein